MSNEISKALQLGQKKIINGKPHVVKQTKSGKLEWRLDRDAMQQQNQQQGAGGGQQQQPQAQKQTDNNAGGKQGGNQQQSTQPKPQAPQAQQQTQGAEPKKEARAPKVGRSLIQHVVNASEDELKKMVESSNIPEQRLVAYRELKHRGKDVSKLKTDGIDLPKVEYKGAPNHHVHVDSVWSGRNAKGQRVDIKKENIQKMLTGKNDADLLRQFVNNPNMEARTRHLAIEEAQRRGIDESKVDLSGDKLKKFWDTEKTLNSAEDDKKVKTEEEELEDFEDFDYGIDTAKADEFLASFPEGDYSWDDENSEAVKKEFNGLKTLKDRQNYDNFLYYAKTSNPNYAKPEKQLQRLKKGYLVFASKGNTRPMMVAAGGAGVGKTYNLRHTLTEHLNLQEYDKDVNENNDDYDYVFAPQINSLPKLAKFLSKHNGKIVIFDDNDDLLTNSDMSNVMKTLGDGNPKARFFPEYDDKGKATGKNSTFTGKIIALTNKSSDYLNRNPDAQAVMSRAKKLEIKFTVQENLDTLKDRYKTMDTGIKIKGMTKQEEEQLRDDIFNYIVDNKNKLDPGKFTVRKFIDVYEKAAEEYMISHLSQTSQSASDDFGDSEDWRDSALEILNKGEEDELDKAEGTDDLAFTDPTDGVDLTPEEKKALKKIDKEGGNQPDETLDDREQEEERENDEKTKKIKKSIMDDMSLEDAENLLFN